MSVVSRRSLIAGSAAILTAGGARAQAAPMTLVVPFPPGGSTDALARQMQTGLQAKLGRTVVVENKAGAAGALGAAAVAKSPADGSSVLITFDSHAVIPAILSKPPLDVETDLVPVFLVGTAPYVVAVNAQRPYKTFADVVAACKEKPGAVKYASVGVGTIGHLAMTLLAKAAGVEITHVAYRGGGPAMNDVVGGHVDLICGSAALISPQLSAGTLRPMMQTGRAKLPNLQSTQTAIEAGFKDFEAVAWWGVFAPKGTPAATVEVIAAAMKETLSDAKITAFLRESQQMSLIFGGPKELDTFFRQQVAQWGKVVRDNAITAQ